MFSFPMMVAFTIIQYTLDRKQCCVKITILITGDQPSSIQSKLYRPFISTAQHRVETSHQGCIVTNDVTKAELEPRLTQMLPQSGPVPHPGSTSLADERGD